MTVKGLCSVQPPPYTVLYNTTGFTTPTHLILIPALCEGTIFIAPIL